ncbi:M23 family metallopeptidase [uncultured Hyphomonas sp.]|uniref:M23 family metallopeptidase n=1 Tax=uncultured Hyphomonas sp. TaxID=225298 RepID=UPI002AAB7F35|nr:M23 family metallopeptidase [uncultured Hyphomonas sp.]
MARVVKARTFGMSGTEKFFFLGAATLAALVMSQAPQDRAVLASNTATSPPEALPSADAIAPPPAILAVKPAPAGYLNSLAACPGLSTANASGVGPDLQVMDFKPVILAAGTVRLATAPVGGGCFSSAFGMRNGRLHKGVDYYSDVPVPVYAAAAGRVRTRSYRSDYGNMIVIDHGNGVYTRYAHLESFDGPDVGDLVGPGARLGIMGNTAGHTIPRHLHYEVLTGTWKPRLGSFALQPVDVMSLPAAED